MKSYLNKQFGFSTLLILVVAGLTLGGFAVYTAVSHQLTQKKEETKNISIKGTPLPESTDEPTNLSSTPPTQPDKTSEPLKSTTPEPTALTNSPADYYDEEEEDDIDELERVEIE